jgi:hypothetical protein
LTCDDWLAVLEPRLTRPLFDPENARRLRRLARILPGECRGTLEVRLAPGAAPVDLSLQIRTAHEARALAERLSSPIGEFLSCWSEPGGPLAPIRSIWLEFDLDREPAENTVPVPVVCAKLPRDVGSGWVLETLIPSLQGHPTSEGQSGVMRSCLDALPAAASLLYVFGLQARGSDAVRLEIFGMETAEIRPYLQSLSPEATLVVEEVLPLFEGVERLHLSFDVADTIQPRIGLEGSFPRQPAREPRWGAFFERLVQKGLCSPSKRDAVLAWPGYDTFWTAPERWPVAELRSRGVCIRTLSHVKTVCQPGREPEAKVYLVFGPLDGSGAGASPTASASAFST